MRFSLILPERLRDVFVFLETEDADDQISESR